MNNRLLLLVLLFFACSLCFATESKVPLVASYDPNPPATGSPDAYHLDPLLVLARRLKNIELDDRFIRAVERSSMRPSSDERRIALSVAAPGLMPLSESRVPFGSRNSYLATKDAFDIDLPWGGKVEATFHSGLSFKLRKDVKFQMFASRKRLLSLSIDF